MSEDGSHTESSVAAARCNGQDCPLLPTHSRAQELKSIEEGGDEKEPRQLSQNSEPTNIQR